MFPTSNQPLPAVGQLPADPQPDTVALLDAVTTPGRSIPHRVWLAHGGLILDPAGVEDAPAITPAQVTQHFQASGLLGPPTPHARPEVRLVRVTHGSRQVGRDRLAWAVIMLAVPGQLGRIGPPPANQAEAAHLAREPVATGNTVAFYDTATGKFLMLEGSTPWPRQPAIPRLGYAGLPDD
jgi:hypothetical protein